MTQRIYRQGDVLLVQVEKRPDVEPEIIEQPSRVVLAHGEVTGHAHAVYDVGRVNHFQTSGMTFLEVLEEVGLKHEEHSEIMLPKGVYQVLIQTEYTPEELRQVAD